MTTQVTIRGAARSYTLSIEAPDSPSFIYSPQILKVTNIGQSAGPSQVIVTLTGVLGTHTETRTMYNNALQFDLRRAMQLVTPDADGLLSRIAQSDTGDFGILYDDVQLSLTFIAGDTGERFDNIIGHSIALICMHGALDQLEVYGNMEHRRLWLNFPQTFNVWEDEYGEVHVYLGGTSASMQLQSGLCVEVDHNLIRALLQDNGVDTERAFRPGQPVELVLSFAARVEEGVVTPQDRRGFMVTPDDSKPSDGVYLRWVTRRGEVGYWLMKRSELESKVSTGQSFTRHYDGNPAMPVRHTFVNSQKADFREARTMTLRATGLSAEEFDYLGDLALSPVVEMLIVPEGAGDSLVGRTGLRWQRVNIAPGTYARSIRRSTPRLYELEVAIELPERNTVTL